MSFYNFIACFVLGLVYSLLLVWIGHQLKSDE